jgi:hypothetical protein
MNTYTAILVLVFLVMGCFARANDTIPDSKKWNYSLSGNFYLFADDVYLNPVFTADNSHLHLEARYNYEDFRTASFWGGYNFSTGDKFQFNASPMLGIVFGNTNGIAPGLLLDMYYWKLNFYSESEYLIDFEENQDSFIYSWSELTVTPAEWLWVGLVAQRTRLYQANLDIQRGFTAEFSWDFISVGGYIFNIDREDPYGVLTLEIQF